ncbi:MAG TPA: lasso peptide biosynthesis B2 protein [Rhodanobacteraceae bacterium]|nr:lasso peptide biosynthesis B2 protein [Rhodanobacteraceae bacterium]
MPDDDRRALLAAAWRLPLVRLLLTTMGLRRAQRLLARAPTRAPPRTDVAHWHARTRALQRIGARMPDTRCLARSLTLWWWMRGHGLQPDLRIGIRRTRTASPAGHAWVECNGQLFDQDPATLTDYAAIHTLHPH